MFRATFTALAGAVLLSVSCSDGDDKPAALDPALEHAQWVVARNWEITVFEGARPVRTLTRGHRDWKPVWSPTGDWIVFFRSIHEDPLDFDLWQTKICVVRADGTAFRELTGGAFADYNPTWTRDGTNQILFDRIVLDGADESHIELYRTAPDAEPGDEQQLPGNGRDYLWVDSGLRDGRLFVDGVNYLADAPWLDIGAWLVGPDGEGGWSWQEVSRPVNGFWHKLSVSPSETRVTFMLDSTGQLQSYSDDVLYWAEFDRDARTVTGPIAITTATGGRCTNEYPRWSPDERFIIYDSDCATGHPVVHAYRLSDGTTSILAGEPGVDLRIASFAGVPQ